MKKNILVLLALTYCFIGVQAQNFVNYTTDNGLPSNNVNCIAIDKDDNIWLGTQEGVAMFDGDDKWTYFTEDDGILKNNVKAIAIDPKTGDVWIGTDYGTGMYDGKDWKNYTKNDGLINNRVNHIGFDIDGSIWFTPSSGVSNFNGTDWKNLTTDEGLPTNLLNFVTVDDKGVKWFGSTLDGVVKYDGTDFTHMKMDEYKFLSDNITSILIDKEGNKWLGSYGGLSYMDDKFELIENYDYKTTDLFTEYVIDLAFDSKDNVWIGAYTDYLNEGALNMFNGTDWETYGVDQNLVSFVIREVAIDSKDIIWVATDNGLSKLTREVGVLDQLADFNRLNLFPNPANSALTINNISGADEVTIYNQAMQKMGAYAVGSGTSQIKVNLDNYAAGMYFVKAGNAVKKLVVTRQ